MIGLTTVDALHVGRVRQTAIDSLNGDYDGVEPALRRSLIAVASEVDSMDHRTATELHVLNKTVKDMKRWLMAFTSSFSLLIVAAAVNIVQNL